MRAARVLLSAVCDVQRVGQVTLSLSLKHFNDLSPTSTKLFLTMKSSFSCINLRKKKQLAIFSALRGEQETYSQVLN